MLSRTMKKQKYFQHISMTKNKTYKTQNLYILLAFLLITIALLITVSIYCYMIKYWARQKHLLPFHSANNELKKPIYWCHKLEMTNKIKDINIKTAHTTFPIILSI